MEAKIENWDHKQNKKEGEKEKTLMQDKKYQYSNSIERTISFKPKRIF